MSSADDPFDALAREVRRLFHQMAATAEALHADEPELGAAHRAVLEALYRDGEQTVPTLARARLVSRQHIQTLVNALLACGYVEPVENPAHRRSPLLRLTARGRARFETMRAREQSLLASSRMPVTVEQMRVAETTLRRLREHLAKSARGARGAKGAAPRRG